MKRKATEMSIQFETEQEVERNVETVGNAMVIAKSQNQDASSLAMQLIAKEENKHMSKQKKAKQNHIKYGAEAYEELFSSNNAPMEPIRRPRFIRDITKPAPIHVKTAAGKFLLPAFEMYATNVNFLYNDNTLKELRGNSYVIGKNGIGKGNVKPMIDAVLSQIEKGDEEGWKVDKEYKQNKEAAGDRKTEKRPEVKIRIIMPNITKPELNQLGEAAGNEPFFMHAQEPDELDVLKGGRYGRQHFELLKKADDEKNTAGQMRCGVKSVSAKYNLKLNYVVEIRPTQLLDFFKGEIINGARDRADLCEIHAPADIHKWPKAGNLGEEYQAIIRRYIDNICAATGTIECKRANKLIDKLRKEFFEYYDETNDGVLELITHRALCRAFRRACLCFIAEGQQWDPALDTWIRWSFMYDMWMQFHYFYEFICNADSELKVTKQGPTSFLSLLPNVFTFEQLKELYIKMGKYVDDENVHGAIRTWNQRHKIERTETGFRKLK